MLEQHQAVTNSRNSLDLEAAAYNLVADLSQSGDDTVEAVIADIDPAPASFEQRLTRDNLASVFGKHDQNLHDSRLQVGCAARPCDFAARWADLRSEELEIRNT